ncbi:MAG: GtrA family protein [Clostridia bacterium]|nr:GtrA family protein [Clostridia bacterium]
MLDKILDCLFNNNLIELLDKKPFLNPITQKLKDQAFVKHILKYLFFGVLTTIISLGSFWILINKSSLNENLCNFISIIIGILSAYIFNRAFVFESKERNIFSEFSKFVISRVFSSLFDIFTFFIFATCLHLNEMIVKIVISIIVIILNYLLSKLIVFNTKK